MFRLFSAKRSPPLESIELSHREAEMFQDCIVVTRKQILETEWRIKALNANLLTVYRCIETRLHFSHQEFLFVYLRFQRVEIFPLLQEYRTRSRPGVYHLSVGSTHRTHWEIPNFSPVHLIERPVLVPEAERVITPPNSINTKDIVSIAYSKPNLEVQLNLLVLKKAELQADVHKLEKDLLF